MEDSLIQYFTTTQMVVESLTREYLWMFIAGVAVLFFKNAIENFVAGVRFYYGSDYNVDDEVYIRGVKKARIVRQSFSKTVFYFEEKNRRLVVPNSSLHSLSIEKVLPRETPPDKKHSDDAK